MDGFNQTNLTGFWDKDFNWLARCNKKEFQNCSIIITTLLPDSSLTVGDLHSPIFGDKFYYITNVEAVIACLLYIPCEGFIGKLVTEKIIVGWLTLADETCIK